MPRASRPPVELLHSIASKADSVHTAAASLTARIERFQEFLNTLPGRVETDYYIKWPHDVDMSDMDRERFALVLRFQRQGKSWILLGGIHDERESCENPAYSVDFKPLTEASLKLKMAAVKSFPDFLEAIEKSQDKLVQELSNIAADYDSFEATLMPPVAAIPGPPTAEMFVVRDGTNPPSDAPRRVRLISKAPPPPPPSSSLPRVRIQEGK